MLILYVNYQKLSTHVIVVFWWWSFQMACQGCRLTLMELFAVCGDSQQLLTLLKSHLLIKDTTNCSKCQSVLTLKEDTLVFRCDKVLPQGHRSKSVSRRCRFRKSAKKGTLFENTSLEFKDIMLLCYLWCCPSNKLSFVCRQTGLSTKTVVDWYSFFRQVCVYYCESRKGSLGGKGSIVEIDEAKFGRKKYNRGRKIEGQWVIGGFERETRNLFFVPIEDRNESTILGVIKQKVLPGTKIITDSSSAYRKLPELGYGHVIVKRSYHFVDPVTGANTQHIRRAWRDVKEGMPTYGRRKEHFVGYLAAAIFKKAFPDERQAFHEFLLAAADLFPPAY